MGLPRLLAAAGARVAVNYSSDRAGAERVAPSTDGGEVVHYLARYGESRVAKAVIISAVPPLMVKTAANPGGLSKEDHRPVLVMDGDDDQIVPYADSAPLSAKLLRNSTLKTYKASLKRVYWGAGGTGTAAA